MQTEPEALMEEETGASYTVQKDVDPSNMSNAVLVNTLDGRLFDMLRDSFSCCVFLQLPPLIPPPPSLSSNPVPS